MSLGRKRVFAVCAPIFGALLGLLMILPLVDRGLSPVTSGVMIGAAGLICLFGIVAGIWNAQRGEARRRAKEQIWLKH